MNSDMLLQQFAVIANQVESNRSMEKE